VSPFPEEDEFEAREIHARRAGNLLVLWGLLIKLEFVDPVRVAERRDRSGEDVPLGDRKAALRQPRDAADHHHGEDHGSDDEEKVGERDGACSVAGCGIGEGSVHRRAPMPAQGEGRQERIPR